MTDLELFSFLVAMGRLCRIAYEHGLSVLTKDEQKAVMCFAGFDVRFVPVVVLS